jgi:misacylated tRNA(Ala) deacylase
MTDIVPTVELFRADAMLRTCEARVTRVLPAPENAPDVGAVLVLDRTVFYPLGGGQAGDRGWVGLGGHRLEVCDTRKVKSTEGAFTAEIGHWISRKASIFEQNGTQQASLLDSLLLILNDQAAHLEIDWAHRQRLMRLHTTTHLLCHLIPVPVDGCSITAAGARMDLVTTDAIDADAINVQLAALVALGLPVVVGQITDAELDAQPELVKSMSVSPPRGSGVVRTIRVGKEQLIDLQPCGGTHVANTAEIGGVRITKIEKKSAKTRRLTLALLD